MSNRRTGKMRVLVFLGLAAWAGAAWGAERAADADLVRVEKQVVQAEERLGNLNREYTQRRGLIGAAEAETRFEDAVYDYLMGNYEEAALAFYSLVESDALVEHVLAQDSQWYLAECLFELGNWATATDVYEAIIAQGNAHPFFVDAVRRELEIYGILNDHEQFYEVYKRHILSGRVPADDAVKYTVAKSFYRQGETVRAKSMFSELGEDSAYYGRARYYLGTVLASEGDYPSAITEFERVVARSEQEEPEVVELACLALGRLYYEMADYTKATEYYTQISSTSDYFADQLYELVWTYIKQEQWTKALDRLEIFLIAFPEHGYTMQMKITQGHLYMKKEAYEQALVSYEGIVESYSPLHERLAELEASREDPAVFFRRIVEMDKDELVARKVDSGDALPTYAVEMLVEDDTMARAVDASRELSRQRNDVDNTSRLIGEVGEALDMGGSAIGTFSRGRAGLRRVQDDALQIRSALVQAEIRYLVENVPDGVKPEVRALERKWDVLRGRTDEVQGVESAQTDRYQVHEDQVREVQKEAGRVRMVADGLKAEASATRRVLSEKRSVLDTSDAQRVEDELDYIERQLDKAIRGLGRLESDTTRHNAMAGVPTSSGTDTERQRDLLVDDFDEVHGLLSSYRRAVTDPDRNAWYSRMDGLWKRADDLDDGVATVRSALDRAEVKELALLRKRLRSERGVVGVLDQKVEDTSADAETLAVDITRSEFGRLEGTLKDTIMRADMGIVDVYWLRKTAVSDEMTRLAKERGLRIQELDGRFDVIRQKLEE